MILPVEDALDWGLPELETFELENELLCIQIFRAWDVHYQQGVGVQVNRFESNKQLFCFHLFISLYTESCISNIQLIFDPQKELEMLWIAFIKSDNENAKFLLEFVCQHVVHLIFIVINYIFNTLNMKHLSQWELLVSLQMGEIAAVTGA